jgi:hypothetical protein
MYKPAKASSNKIARKRESPPEREGAMFPWDIRGKSAPSLSFCCVSHVKVAQSCESRLSKIAWPCDGDVSWERRRESGVGARPGWDCWAVWRVCRGGAGHHAAAPRGSHAHRSILRREAVVHQVLAVVPSSVEVATLARCRLVTQLRAKVTHPRWASQDIAKIAEACRGGC